MGLDPKHCWHYERKKLICSAVDCGGVGCHVESDCRNPRLRNLNSTVPVDVVRVKSYVNNLLSSTTVPVRVSVNKLNPERILPGLRSQV